MYWIALWTPPTTTWVRFPAREVPWGYGCITLVVVPRLPRGTLNRGAVCVRMHLSACMNLKELGRPSQSLGVQKQTDGAGIQKRPEPLNVATYGWAN